MSQESWKNTEQDKRGGRPGKRRTFWSWLFWGQVLVLGALVAVLALKVGLSHAFEGQGWRKFAGPVVESFARDHNPSWDQVLGRLTDDDDEDDGDEDDNGTS